jgi:hypothetical protein
MAFQQYALLDSTKTVVVGFQFIDSNGNIPANALPIVNAEPPTFDPTQSFVTQNGWTVGTASVTQNWVIQSLSVAQTQDVANSQVWNSAISQNIVSQGKSALANWSSLTPTQKDTVLQNCLKVLVALLQYQYGILN